MDLTWGYVAGEAPRWDENLFQNGDEVDTAVLTLERNRRTFAWKCDGVDAVGLNASVASSSLTLGGLLVHLAWVEELYFQAYVAGRPLMAPFDGVDLDEWESWPWSQAATEGPDERRALWVRSVHRSRVVLAEALSRGGLEQSTLSGMNLRRILADLIEEYARHTGHADLIREHLDGRTGEGAPREFPVP